MHLTLALQIWNAHLVNKKNEKKKKTQNDFCSLSLSLHTWILHPGQKPINTEHAIRMMLAGEGNNSMIKTSSAISLNKGHNVPE